MRINAVCLQGSMTIGIDVNALVRSNYTGVERYVFELLREMMKTPLAQGERVFLYASEPVASLGVLPEGWEWKVLHLPMLKKGWTHIRLSWELLMNPLDVFFCPAHEVPLGAVRSKVVTTIHDVAFVHVPEVYSTVNRVRQAWAVKRAMRWAQKILTVSNTTRDDLKKYYRVDEDRAVVTRLGIRPELFVASEEQVQEIRHVYHLEQDPYWLTIGRLEKKKGIVFLADVFDAYVSKHPESNMRLVLGGKFGHGKEEIEERIEQSANKDRIHVLGFVPDEHLAPLMRGAQAYVFASTYEGFGIPALEAMAAGAPVVASDIPALREVCADAARVCAYGDVEAWVKALELVDDQRIRESFIEKGHARVQDFNWAQTARKTWEVIRSMK